MIIVDYVAEQITTYPESMPKDTRNKIGQYFAPRETAEFMANMADVDSLHEVVGPR